jgi:hypothetical protein
MANESYGEHGQAGAGGGKPDKPRNPGDKPKQFVKVKTNAGKGTAHTYQVENQGDARLKEGLFGGVSICPKPFFRSMSSEAVYPSAVNADIVIGPYKPRGEYSGGITKGDGSIATIDLVAGRMGSYARTYNDEEDFQELKARVEKAKAAMDAISLVAEDDDTVAAGDGSPVASAVGNADALAQAQQTYLSLKSSLDNFTERSLQGPDQKAYTDNNYLVDSARVVICQKGTPDVDFGIRPGRTGTAHARSFVAIKGDVARVIGREGIKLVTGTDKENSQGGIIDVPRGIELIAGNDDRFMQPLVKGTNMLECIDDLNDNLSRLNGIVLDFMLNQSLFNTALGFHQHFNVTLPAPLASAAAVAGGLPAVPVSLALPDFITAMPAWGVFTSQAYGVTFGSILINKLNIGRTYFKYLVPKPFRDDKFICSKSNYTN